MDGPKDRLKFASMRITECNNSDRIDRLFDIRNYIISFEKVLKTKKTSPNFVYNGQTRICQTASSGFEDIVDPLLRYRCDRLCKPDKYWSRQPIHYAAEEGHLGIVKQLLKQGVDINSLDSQHRTPLHWGALYGRIKIVEYLLSAGACVNIAQVNGCTPLNAALSLGHEDVCFMPIANGADVNRADQNGWTPLRTAVHSGCKNLVKILLDWGASVNQTTSNGENCCHNAVRSGRFFVLKMLLEAGIDVDKKDINGFTAFHLSLYKKELEIFRFLIQKHVNMCTENLVNQSPLYLAAMRGEEELLQMMLDGGYDASREKWLHNNWIPAAIESKPILEVLRFYAKNPRTLKELTCIRVRRCLSDIDEETVDLLPLPNSLRKLIRLSKFELY